MPDTHHLKVSGPFADDAFIVEQMTGRESLGRLFQYEVSLLGKSPKVDLGGLIGDKLTISVMEDHKPLRHFGGYVTRMARVGTFGQFARYRVTLHPWFHILSARVNSRIFQNKSVLDIAKVLFREHGFTDFKESLSESYPAREYVVQYRESDFNFVSRLLEHAGIYYYFKHEANRHVMVLGDSPHSHETVSDYEKVAFHPEGAAVPGGPEFVNAWELAHQWRSGAYTADDYDFTRPKAELMAKLKGQSPHKLGDLEVYDYPGGFPDHGAGQSYVQARLEALQSDTQIGEGAGDVRGLGAGDLFDLTGYPLPDQNRKYLVVSSTYDMANNPVQSAVPDPNMDGHFRWSFSAIASDIPFRPPLETRRPRVEGVQTAVVVGPGGDEIATDKYGRVKVQFHWDREGKNDENSSCWIRVAQLWAGSHWGGMHIPRIGQEVLVDFLEGDPDRPVIVGRLYNADQMPPYELPANKTQSGIKSRSSKGGGASNFNELRFEDKKGSEEVYVQAEKDLTVYVKHDEARGVDHDRSTEIGHDETITVGHNRTETVQGDESITIAGTRTETVTKDETITVAASRSRTVALADAVTVGVDRSVTVGGNESTAVGASQSTTVGASQSTTVGTNQSASVGGARSTDVGKEETVTVGAKRTVTIGKDDSLEVGAKLSINVKDEISITTGDATISMKKNGDITIKGKNITIEGSGKVNVKASSDVIIKGSKIAKN